MQKVAFINNIKSLFTLYFVFQKMPSDKLFELKNATVTDPGGRTIFVYIFVKQLLNAVV